MTQIEAARGSNFNHRIPWIKWALTAGGAIVMEIALRFIEHLLQHFELLEPKGDSESQLALFAATLIGSSALELLASTVVLISVAFLISNQTQLRFWKALNQTLIESVRALSAVIIRVPLFIVPAVFEWFRLLPVPFVVLFDSSYAQGRSDALEASRSLFHRFKIRVALAFLLMMVPPLLDWGLSQIAADSLPIWDPSSAPRHIAFSIALGLTKLATDAALILIFRGSTLTSPINS